MPDMSAVSDQPENRPEQLTAAVQATGELSAPKSIVIAPQISDQAQAMAVATPNAPLPTGPSPVVQEADTSPASPISAASAAEDTNTGQHSAVYELENEIKNIESGLSSQAGASRPRLLQLCQVIDYWLGHENESLITENGLGPLASETRRDYVMASLLGWKGEFKLARIALRSFLEGFCLLLYYLNQGCDRLLYLRGQGYKLMLHRMAQKKSDPEDMHAFRRHYHLLISDGCGNAKYADRFFLEIGDCYGILSKAVHGDYNPKEGCTPGESLVTLLERVLRVCNTLALYDPVMGVTDDDIQASLQSVLTPVLFEEKSK